MRRQVEATFAGSSVGSGNGRGLRRLAFVATLAFAALLALGASGAWALGAERVYEQVSPVVKNGNSAGAVGDFSLAPYSWVTPDGNAVLYGTSLGAVGETEIGLTRFAVSRRTANGWTTANPFPRPLTGSNIFAWGGSTDAYPSDDLTRFAIATEATFDPADHGGGIYMTTPTGVEWVTRPRISDPLTAQKGRYHPAGGSSDLRTLYFNYDGVLAPGETARAAMRSEGVQASGLYMYRDGQLSPVGVLPDGSLAPGGAVAAATWKTSESAPWGPWALNNQVSRDGSRAFFISPDPASGMGPPQLYVRIDGEHTMLVSKSNLTQDAAAKGAGKMSFSVEDAPIYPYVFASPDGHTAIFKSEGPLTADAPANGGMYRWDEASGDVTYLPDLDTAPDLLAGQISGMVWSSKNGDEMLYVDRTNLKVQRVTRSGVSTLFSYTVGSKITHIQSASDDSVVVFATDMDIPGVSPGGSMQVIRYVPADGQMTCISCVEDPSGQSWANLGFGDITAYNYAGALGELRFSNVISNDGRTIFFGSETSLVPRDTNGTEDVYEWHDGSVSLITSGKSPTQSMLLGASRSGDDVFFTTKTAFAPEDNDGNFDVYDARVGGGFPQAPTPALCVSTCQGDVGVQEPLGPIASMAFSGGGNSGADRRRADRRSRNRSPRIGGVQGVSSSEREDLARGGTARLKVRVNGSGMVSLVGTARIGGQTADVASSSVRATEAGKVSLPFSLSQSAGAALRRKGSLPVSLVIHFKDARPRVVELVLRASTAKRGGQS